MKYDIFVDGALYTVEPFSFTQPFSDGHLPRMGGKLYIQSSSIRGKLRRLARDVIYETMGYAKLPLADFYFLTLGGVKSGKTESEKESEDKLVVNKVMAVREKNPLVSLFGAMAPQTIPGRLMVSHAIAMNDIHPDTVKHVRTNDLMRSPDVVEMLDDSALADYVAMKNEADIRSKASADIKAKQVHLRKLDKSSDAYATLNAEIQALKKEKDGMTQVQVGLPNLEYEVIPQGATLSSRFILSGVTEREIVLFFKAMDKFSQNPQLGAKANHGLGVISGEWDVRIRSAGTPMETAGRLTFAGDYMPAQATGKVREWIDAPLDLSGCNFSAELAA